MYKDKLPSFLRKKFMKNADNIIRERKEKLAQFMQKLSFNIFLDDDIVRFLKKDYDDA